MTTPAGTMCMAKFGSLGAGVTLDVVMVGVGVMVVRVMAVRVVSHAHGSVKVRGR